MKKLILFMFMVFMSFSVVSATLDDAEVYYSYDVADVSGSTLIDLSGNSREGYCNNMASGCNTLEGLLLNGSDFDGTNDHYLSNYQMNPTINDFSLSLWVKPDSTAFSALFSNWLTSGNQRVFEFYLDSSNSPALQTSSNGVANSVATSNTTISSGVWSHLVLTKNGTTASFYINGVATGTGTVDGTLHSYVQNLSVGARSNNLAIPFDGKLDETGIYSRVLTGTEITELYNSGAGVNPYLANAPTIAYNVTDNAYLNYQPSIELTTTSNTNMSVIFNGASELSLCTECNSTTYTPTLVVGQNNFTFISTNADGQSNSTLTLNYDVTNPTITNNLPIEIDSYLLDFNSTTCSDTNIDTCILTIQNTNYDLLTLTNATLTYNGNSSYTINATDLAGNFAQDTGVILVNPIISFQFNDSGSLITDYSFGGRSDTTGIVNYTIYNDGLSLGVNTLEFSKLGYITQNFNFTFTNTTNQNYVFNVTPSIINVNIYDRVTEALITENVSLQLVGNVGDTTTTVTGQATMQAINGIAGDYQIIASSALYETESVYFTYSNQENLTTNIYLIQSNETNIGVVNIEVKDTLSFFIEGATVNLLEWKPAQSAYVTTAQCSTGSNGRCALNVELFDKLYKFQAVKSGVSKTTNSQILSENNLVIPITLGDATLTISSDLDTFSYSFAETIVGNVTTTRFEFLDTSNLVTEACIQTYKSTGFSQQLLAQNCTSSNSGIIFKNDFINNTFDISIYATVTSNGVEYRVGEINHAGSASLSNALEDNNLDILIPAILFFVGLFLGLLFGNLYISLIAIVILQWLATVIAPSQMNASIAVSITVLAGLTLWGLSKK